MPERYPRTDPPRQRIVLWMMAGALVAAGWSVVMSFLQRTAVDVRATDFRELRQSVERLRLELKDLAVRVASLEGLGRGPAGDPPGR